MGLKLVADTQVLLPSKPLTQLSCSTSAPTATPLPVALHNPESHPELCPSCPLGRCRVPPPLTTALCPGLR